MASEIAPTHAAGCWPSFGWKLAQGGDMSRALEHWQLLLRNVDCNHNIKSSPRTPIKRADSLTVPHLRETSHGDRSSK